MIERAGFQGHAMNARVGLFLGKKRQRQRLTYLLKTLHKRMGKRLHPLLSFANIGYTLEFAMQGWARIFEGLLHSICTGPSAYGRECAGEDGSMLASLRRGSTVGCWLLQTDQIATENENVVEREFRR